MSTFTMYSVKVDQKGHFFKNKDNFIVFLNSKFKILYCIPDKVCKIICTHIATRLTVRFAPQQLI